MHELIKIVDVTIMDGHRNKEKQDNYYHAGTSKLKYPQSKHNKNPSEAVDIAIWHKEEPHIRWHNNDAEWYYLNGLVKGIAHKLGINIRSGSDWDSDNDFKDQKFIDFPHFELE